MNEDINTLRRILQAVSRTIAVVGLSANWYRPSYFAAKYMQEHGYRVIPVNPPYPEVLGREVLCVAARHPGKGGHGRLLPQERRTIPRSPRTPSRSAPRCCGSRSG